MNVEMKPAHQQTPPLNSANTLVFCKRFKPKGANSSKNQIITT